VKNIPKKTIDELIETLEFCIKTMEDNDEYGWKDEAVKKAKEALSKAQGGA